MNKNAYSKKKNASSSCVVIIKYVEQNNQNPGGNGSYTDNTI